VRTGASSPRSRSGARASLVDKSPRRQARQRPPALLPGRQLRGGFATGARSSAGWKKSHM
jgi:hypothetical protein